MYQDLLALQVAEKTFYDAQKRQDHSSTCGNQEVKKGIALLSEIPKIKSIMKGLISLPQTSSKFL